MGAPPSPPQVEQGGARGAPPLATRWGLGALTTMGKGEYPSSAFGHKAEPGKGFGFGESFRAFRCGLSYLGESERHKKKTPRTGGVGAQSLPRAFPKGTQTPPFGAKGGGGFCTNPLFHNFSFPSAFFGR